VSTREPDGGGVFELTVEGALGPVMRSVLRASSVHESHACTTIRTAADCDLTGLVELLDSQGLVIEGVWVVPVES
jgi:hypothetical protein